MDLPNCMISADENPKNWSTTQKSTPPALSYPRAVSGKRHKPLGRPDRNTSIPGARGTKNMPGRAHRPPREKPAKKGAGEKTKANLPDESGAGDAWRRFKRPVAVVNSCNYCCQYRRILAGSNDPSMLTNVKAIIFGYYKQCSGGLWHLPKALSSGSL